MKADQAKCVEINKKNLKKHPRNLNKDKQILVIFGRILLAQLAIK